MAGDGNRWTQRVRDSVIGDDVVLDGPFGPRRVVYADATARRGAPGHGRSSSTTPITKEEHVELSPGRHIPGLIVGGRELRAPVVNEREVRAAAGITLALGAVAFSYAYFAKEYVPLQVVATLFFVEFLVRVTAGIRYSPAGRIARAMTRGQPPEWVSAKPKRFAWTLGLVMAGAMAIITNSGIRGYLPRTICLICLTLMWMETALGLCLGCKIHGLLVARGWAGADPEVEVCADGACRSGG